MALKGSSDHEKLQSLINSTHKEQSIWFLNAFWDAFASNEAERIWGYVQKLNEIDLEKHELGNAVDEVRAHKFLEFFGETLTVLSMREKLRQTGAIAQSDRPKLVPITHYLLFRYNSDWHQLVNTKGDNTAEIAEAQRLLDSVMSAFQESDARAKEARDAETAARIQEAPFKAAQEEVDRALADVKAQEEKRESRTAELTRKSGEGGVVAQNKAKAELAQHLAEDPLPLRKAKVTLEAALKKAEKARAPFEAATKIAVEARNKAEEALENTRQKVAEAEAYLDEVKKKPGTPHGAIWFMERELNEKKKFLPERKGGVSK